jgi:hypothetical protein
MESRVKRYHGERRSDTKTLFSATPMSVNPDGPTGGGVHRASSTFFSGVFAVERFTDFPLRESVPRRLGRAIRIFPVRTSTKMRAARFTDHEVLAFRDEHDDVKV